MLLTTSVTEDLREKVNLKENISSLKVLINLVTHINCQKHININNERNYILGSYKLRNIISLEFRDR